MLRSFRTAARLSQKALSVKTELVDSEGIGIDKSILSQLETGKRNISAKYLRLLQATGVFSVQQIQQLFCQAIIDRIRQDYDQTVTSITFSLSREEIDDKFTS